MSIYFLCFLIISPLKRVWPFILNKLESPSPKGALWQVWLKLACREVRNDEFLPTGPKMMLTGSVVCIKWSCTASPCRGSKPLRLEYTPTLKQHHCIVSSSPRVDHYDIQIRSKHTMIPISSRSPFCCLLTSLVRKERQLFIS